jgi:hypothetical protein
MFPQLPQLLMLLLRFTSQPLPTIESQFAKPALQEAMPHAPAEQLEVAFEAEQVVAHVPQWVGSVLRLTSQPFAALPSQFEKPALQLMPQVVPSHVAEPLAGTAQAVQLAPQFATDALLTQLPPHAWKPALHAIPQLVPSHVALPLAGTTHALQEVPQLAVLVLRTQAPAHRW